MSPATVDDATLTGPDLRELLDGTGGPVLRRCTADEPDLHGADLSGATGALLTETRLDGCRMIGADLSGLRGLAADVCRALGARRRLARAVSASRRCVRGATTAPRRPPPGPS